MFIKTLYNAKHQRFFALHISERQWFSSHFSVRVELTDSIADHCATR